MSAEAAAISASSRSAILFVAVVLGCSAMGVALDLTALLLGETLALYWQRCNMLLREPQRCCTRSMALKSKLHSRSRQLASLNILATPQKLNSPARNTQKRLTTKMILTNCAACAAPLAHDAPTRCVRCHTRYCVTICVRHA